MQPIATPSLKAQFFFFSLLMAVIIIVDVYHGKAKFNFEQPKNEQPRMFLR